MGQTTRSHGGPSHLPGRVVPQLIFRLFALARSVSSPSCPGFLPRCQQIAGHLALGAVLLAGAGVSLRDEAHAQASPDPAVCARTPRVSSSIVNRTPGVTTCSDITANHLARINVLVLNPTSAFDPLTTLKSGDFNGLTGLTELGLQGNELSSLPSDIFSGLTSLINLNLGTQSGQLSSLPSDIFNPLTNLETLNLDGAGLSSPPANIFNSLTSLQTLSLKGNYLHPLPASIFNSLTNLQELDLEESDLSSLPANIFNSLTNLQTLNLQSNYLSSLPSGIFNSLTNLQTLDLTNSTGFGLNLVTFLITPNPLDLPSGIFDPLTNLQVLDLSFTGLTTLPSNIFANNTMLRELSMQAVELTTIEEAVFSTLSRLTELNLNGNHLATLPSDIFSGITMLEVLKLENNHLTEIEPNTFSGLTRLRTLEILFQCDASDPTDCNTNFFSAGLRLYNSTGEGPLSNDPINIDASTSASESYSIVLLSPPTSDVRIDLSSSDETVASVPESLTIANSMRDLIGWNIPQPVRVTAQQSNGIATISHTIATADTDYSALRVDDVVSVTVIGRDNPEVLVTNADDRETSEDLDDAIFQMHLAAEPTATVTVTPSSSDTNEGLVSGPLTFTPINYATPQSVIVTGVDDRQADGDQPYSITFTVTGDDTTGYADITLTPLLFINRDNEENPSLLMTNAENLETSEAGGTATFYLRLATEPTAAVTVTPSSSDTTEGAVSGPLTFNPRNYDTPQSVTVTGVDDRQADGDQPYQITFSVSSSDENYNRIVVIPLLSINKDDEENSSLLVTNADDQETSEDLDDATFQVRLATQPTTAVTVTPSSSDTTEGAVSGPLTFTPSDWGTAQSITVTGVDDRQADGDQPYQITFSVSSSDENYNRIVVIPILFINRDNEGDPMFTVTGAENLETSEAGGTATVQMRLAAEPTAAVTVTLSSSDTTEGAVSGPLTFTPSDWGTAQSVTVTGMDDRQADGDQPYQVTFSVSSSDENYNRIVVIPLLFINKDDEESSSLLVTDAEDLETSEAGGTDSFQMRLSTEPTAAVTVTPSSEDTSEGAVSGPLTFTPSNWDTAQSVTVTGVDDAELDGDPTYQITFSVSSSDENYNDFQVPPVSVTNRDNDPGLVLTMAQNRETLETSEAGGTDSFQMRLATEPAAAVTVTPTSSDATEGAVSGPPLTFTPSDWGTAQTITVTGVDDDEVDDDQFYRITFSVSSSDANYNDFQAPGLPAINRDDGNDEASAMRETERKAAQEAVDTSLPDLGQTVAGQVLDTIQGRFQGRFLSSPQFNVAGQSMVGTSLDEHLLAWATGRGVVTEQQLVEGTSLDLTLAPGNGVAPGLSLWAMGDLAQFDRENDGLSMDGNVTTLLAGGDWGREQWSAGAALARSWSSSSYRSGQQEGESEVNLTTLLPYGHYEVNPQLSVWGMVGYGWGNLSITPDGQEAMETDMNLSMAAVGLEGLLLDGGRDGLSLSSIADVLLVNVSSEESNDLDETQSDVSRLRLGLQASRSFPLEDDASLAPMVELALRRDGKDDEADFGLDLSVGLDWSDPRQGTHAGLEGRVLLYHAEEGFHTSGITASLEWDPTPATDRGASLSLKHGVGAATGGGVDALLSSASLPDPTSTANSREQQFQALLGYGFAPWGEEGLSITPEIGLGLSSGGREYSLSWSTSPYIQPGEESAWEVSTTVKRQENNDSHPAATHSLDLRFSLAL